VSDFLSHIEKSIRSRRLFQRGERLLVAVSGGVDSMVLLHVLHELARRNKWRLMVAHLNHQLRGRSSDADERLVRKSAEKLGLPLVVEQADVRKFALSQKLSLEMASRKLRHEFLARVAARHKLSSIALAHHADDQLELFFLRLLRGSGGQGLAGMKWCNPSPGNPKIRLVRPFLDQTKPSLKEFAVRQKIPFREDATNALLDIQRNRIRHELLPLLREKYQPALDRTVLRAMEISGAEADFVTTEASKWLAGKRRLSANFDTVPVAVQRRCMQIQLLKLGIAADYHLVEQLRLSPDRPVPVSGAKMRCLIRNPMGLVHLKEPATSEFNDEQLNVELATAGVVVFSGVRIEWRIRPRNILGSHKSNLGTECFDADAVGSRFVLRHWQAGDRFQPIGMAFSLKLQDFFTNQKVKRPLRHQLVVAVTEGGEVFWIEGMRISERFKLTPGSIRRLQWCWRRV
jgi:tRNA(Ile)-lysidine synthase